MTRQVRPLRRVRRKAVRLSLGLCTGTLVLAGCSVAVDAAPTGSILEPDSRGCLPASTHSTTGSYSIGQENVVFVDHTRTTPSDAARGLPAEPDRRLPVIIEYPTPRVRGVQRAIPVGTRPAPGPFPLVLVAHGVTSNGSVMAGLALPWVHAGYVVAAPTFPRSSGPGGGDSDLPEQPWDVRFVITSLQKYFAAPSQLLHGHVAARCLAVAGHSGGAATALSVGYESGVADRRIKAVISMSGVAAPLTGGRYTHPPRTPLLLIHGDKDTTVPIAFSRQAFLRLRVPRIFVTLHGADHISVFLPPAGPVLDKAVVDFLNATLRGDQKALEVMRQQIGESADATMRSAG